MHLLVGSELLLGGSVIGGATRLVCCKGLKLVPLFAEREKGVGIWYYVNIFQTL